MKIKVLIVSVFFVWSLSPVISLAQNKVVVIPLSDQQAVRPTATMYTVYAAGSDEYKDMIDVSVGDCFLTKVYITAQDGTVGEDTNACTIFDDSTSGKWVLKARASVSCSTDCTARCLKW